MNPYQKNKVDISSLSPDEQRLLRLYGKIPTKKDLLQNKLKERKYFDSGDYALSKAGKASDVGVTSIGSRHPVPENIPHLAATSPGTNTPTAGAVNVNGNNNGASIPATSIQPMPGSISNHPGSLGFHSRGHFKEGSFVQRKSSLKYDNNDDDEEENRRRDVNQAEDEGEDREQEEGSISPPPVREGVPIRR